MRIATMWKSIALIDLGLVPLTNERAVNSTERLQARDAPKGRWVQLTRVANGTPLDLDVPAFLKRQAD